MYNNLKKYAPATVRIGLSLVFLWFGFNQIFDGQSWISYLPSFVYSLPIKALTFVFLNGLFEVILAGMLIIGVYTRLSSALLSLHLLGIIFSLGYNEIAVRDIGLFFAGLSVFFNGADDYCIDKTKN